MVSLDALYKVCYDKSTHYLYNLFTESKVIRNKTDVGILSKISNFTNEPSHIIDNIYIGNGYNAANFDLLKTLNIKLIVNITEELSNYFENDFNYFQIKILDNDESFISNYIDLFFNEINKFNQNNINGNILIHCYMGSSRSASFVIAYLMKYHQKKYPEALLYLENKRENININIKFENELIHYFDCLEI